MARGADLDFVHVRWIKGHVNYRAVSGIDKIHAWFNRRADAAVNEALKGHVSALCQHMVEDFQE